jgi:hypothetical protein
MAKWFKSQGRDIEAMELAGGLALLAGLVIIVYDLVRILPNRDVPVTVDLSKVPHDLVLDGTATARATEAVVRVSDLGPVAYTVVLVAALLPTITLMTVAVCFTVLGSSFRTGDFFASASLRAINVAAATLALGSVAIPSLRGTAASSALASVDIGPGVGMTLEIDLVMTMAGLLLATVGYAFQRGARLQQDTEGLV